VHGGASPAATWGALAPLGARWTLASVHRRGYPPSPPLDGRQDFAVDAADIFPLLSSRPHIVAHSYGVLGALIAAAQRPQDVRSLTLIEPPLYHLVPGDPEVERLERIGDAVLSEGLDADPKALRAFLRMVGAPGVDDGPLPEAVANGVRRAHRVRGAVRAFPPRQTRPRLNRPSWPALKAGVSIGAGTDTRRRRLSAVRDGEPSAPASLTRVGVSRLVPGSSGIVRSRVRSTVTMSTASSVGRGGVGWCAAAPRGAA
jgi:pimeloyl-ACP methyl ester carboxylesterase